MIFNETRLKGSFIIEVQPHVDERGWFGRFYCKKEFEQIGHHKEWVQFNHSFTLKKGSLRGMHFQISPYREIKMIRCISGSVYDVIIDIRKGSPTFLQWFGAELSARNKNMIYIPEGFAHGFQCLSDDCELIYHHTEYYKPGYEGGLRFDDPALKIKWPLPITVISESDLGHAYIDQNFKGI